MHAGEEVFEHEGSEDMQAAAVALLQKLIHPQHSTVRALYFLRYICRARQ